ncbi:universal stress protein [Sediminibacterium roseum]|uniref:Universal stress protein n=1 Tax=Sediminibacterium roseum TaxID=1978412 RepID=A0ABW9ZUK2_9BACT|nr:universal stress protein [Sediminibacterium roseum]NCI50821.1 universal stress protein [Sediminibacterium roseum]
MNESAPIVKRILLPVNLDQVSLAMARQVAGLAKDHGAALLLLHVADAENISFGKLLNRFFCTDSFVSNINHKDALLKTWQRNLQVSYGIPVSGEVCCGDWAGCILSAATARKVDMVALTRPPEQRWWTIFKNDPLETVMRRSPCQVMTLFSSAPGTNEWKNIVIPVTGFVPETRLKTIYPVARNNKVKIHLITIDNNDNSPQFSFIMDTLKILKAAGNIQVECNCIKRSMNPEQSFVEYAGRVNADVLMTAKRLPYLGFRHFWRRLLRPFSKLSRYEPGTLYRPSL